jgi:hypothetical protein
MWLSREDSVSRARALALFILDIPAAPVHLLWLCTRRRVNAERLEDCARADHCTFVFP